MVESYKFLPEILNPKCVDPWHLHSWEKGRKIGAVVSRPRPMNGLRALLCTAHETHVSYVDAALPDMRSRIYIENCICLFPLPRL